jgi:signal peptidase I
MYYGEQKTEKRIVSKLIMVGGGIIAGFLITRIIIVPFRVPDDSMEPSLQKGSIAFVLKPGTPVRGDIVLVENSVASGRVMLRRVAATEGDSVELRDRVFYLGGRSYSFPWKTRTSDTRIFPMSFSSRDNMPVVRIKRKHYFILCDNLDRGYDSRTLGVIPAERIMGRVVYVH